MSFGQSKPLVDGTRLAGANLFDKQFHIVKLDSDGDVVLCAAVDDKPYGVLQNAPRQGEEAAVLLVGVTPVVAGAEIAAIGATIGTSDTGRAVAKVAGTNTTHYAIGVNLTVAEADGVHITAAVSCLPPARAA